MQLLYNHSLQTIHKKLFVILMFMAFLSQPEIIAQRFGNYLQFGKIELEKENYTEAIKYFNNSIKHITQNTVWMILSVLKKISHRLLFTILLILKYIITGPLPEVNSITLAVPSKILKQPSKLIQKTPIVT